MAFLLIHRKIYSLHFLGNETLWGMGFSKLCKAFLLTLWLFIFFFSSLCYRAFPYFYSFCRRSKNSLKNLFLYSTQTLGTPYQFIHKEIAMVRTHMYQSASFYLFIFACFILIFKNIKDI